MDLTMTHESRSNAMVRDLNVEGQGRMRQSRRRRDVEQLSEDRRRGEKDAVKAV